MSLSKANIERFPIVQFTKESIGSIEKMLATEFSLTIIMNDQELVTLLCSPENLEYLAVGFLSSEGFIKSRDEIKKVVVDGQKGVLQLKTVQGKRPAQDILSKQLITSGCGRGASFYSTADAVSRLLESQMKISVDEVFTLVKEFQHSSRIYLRTHGVHSAALYDRENMLAFSEDIGRHNAIDKIFGECFLEDIPTTDRIVVTSGRVTSEIVHKVARRSIPIIISISVPTNLGVRVAENLGITLIGSVRGKKMNVYTYHSRVSYHQVSRNLPPR